MSENRLKAETFFHKEPENLNCAQSVLKAFQKEFDVSDEKIAEYKAFGGGRAEGGICGALFAAKYLLQEHEAELEEAFKTKLGYITCKELKANKVDCISCVACADKLVEGFGKNCG